MKKSVSFCVRKKSQLFVLVKKKFFFLHSFVLFLSEVQGLGQNMRTFFKESCPSGLPRPEHDLFT